MERHSVHRMHVVQFEATPDAAPEGGCAFAVTALLRRDARLRADAEVVIFNTGSGASYRFD